MELLWQLASNKSGGCGSDMVWWRVHTFIRRVHTFSFHDVVGCRWVSLTQKTIYGLHSFDVHEGESHGMQNTTHGVVERGRVARVRGWSQKSYWNFWKIFAKMSKYLYQRAICLNLRIRIYFLFLSSLIPPLVSCSYSNERSQPARLRSWQRAIRSQCYPQTWLHYCWY